MVHKPAFTAVAALAAGLVLLAGGYWNWFVQQKGPRPDKGFPPAPTRTKSLLGMRWDFSDGSLAGWRHKDNARIAIVEEGANKALRLSSDFGQYAFAWATCYFEPCSAQGTEHLAFRVRGDGSGHRLVVHLGTPAAERGRWLYYINARQAVTLDFVGWRPVTLDLEQFATPPNGLRRRDMARVAFVEFMVHATGPNKPVDIWLDDIAFGPATAEKQARLEERQRARQRLVEQCLPPLRAARTRLDELKGQLDQRAEAGQYVALARAYWTALAWCADDIHRTLQADELELVEKAPTLLAALERRLADRQAVLGRVLARRPEETDRLGWDKNRYFRSVVGGVRPWIESERWWPKGRRGYEAIPDAWSFRTLGDTLFALVWSISRPGSPLRHHPMALTNALNLLDTIAHQHTDGDFTLDRTAVHGRDPNINRFCLAPALDALAELDKAYPHLLPEPWQQELEAGFRRLVDFQVAEYGTARLARRPDIKQPAYPNMDVHYLLIMELAYQRWRVARYAAERDAFLRILESAVYPEGAFTYIHTQNECFVYHGLTVAYLARYWLLSRDARALELLRKTIPYYPYNVEPAGMPESYTDPSWKHYWTGGDAIGPAIIASLFEDPLNQQVAETCAAIAGYGRGHLGAIAAECWKPVTAKPLPDNYVRFDANIQGPRGRYGAWSFAGNGRNYGTGYQGKDTFVGAMITRPAQRRQLPLDSALQVVTTEVRLNHTDNHWTGGRCHSAQERLTTTVGPDFGSLAVVYTVSRPHWHYRNDELLPWQGVQTWYLGRWRLIGLVSLEATADDTRAAVHGRIRLGLRRTAQAVEPGTWRYGRMLVQLHKHNYAQIVLRPSETFYLDPPEVRNSTEITLLDPLSTAAGQRGTVRFPKGTRYWFLMEARPDDAPPATNLRRIEEPNVTGFCFDEPGRHVAVLHNPTADPVEARLPAEWPSGTQVRQYAGRDGRGEPLSAGRIIVDLPPYSHVVLIGEETSRDEKPNRGKKRNGPKSKHQAPIPADQGGQ